MSDETSVLEGDLGSRFAVTRLLVLRAGLLGMGYIATVGFGWLVVADFGEATFGKVALIAAIPLLIPFADFGLGVSVVSAASDARVSADPGTLVGTVRQVVRILSATAFCVAVAAWILVALDWWPAIVGVDSSPSFDVSVAVATVVTVFAASLIVSQGTRVLQGLGRVELAVSFNAAVPLLAFFGALLVHMLGLGALAYVLVAPLASLAVNAVASWVALVVAARKWPGVAHLLARRPRVAALLRWGGLSILISVSVAGMTQGARLIVAHRSGASELATFAVTWTVFAGANALAAVYGQFLWPRWRGLATARNLTEARFHSEYRRALGVVIAVGLAATAAAWVTFPVVLGAGAPWLIVIACACAAMAQAIHQPAAMVLMDRRGMATQVRIIVPVAVATLMLTYLCVPALGAAAGFVALAACVALVQAPLTYFAARIRVREAVWEVLL